MIRAENIIEVIQAPAATFSYPPYCGGKGSLLAGSAARPNLAHMFELAPEKWTMQGVLWGFLVFGALIAGAGLVWTASTALFLSRAEKTTGVIVDVVAIQSTRNPGESQHARQPTNYYPVVEFRDSTGRNHQVKSSRAARSDHFKRGDEAGVFYDPKAPSRAFIRDTWILWFNPGVILGGGLVWVLFVGAMLMMAQRFDSRLSEDKARFFNQRKARAEATPVKDPEAR
jgi:hypothetical protein